MSLNIILYLNSFSRNSLTILGRLLYIYIQIIQFWHSANVRLSYHFRGSLLWMLSSLLRFNCKPCCPNNLFTGQIRQNLHHYLIRQHFKRILSRWPLPAAPGHSMLTICMMTATAARVGPQVDGSVVARYLDVRHGAHVPEIGAARGGGCWNWGQRGGVIVVTGGW